MRGSPTGLPAFMPLWVLCASAVLFVLMGIDKRRAKRGRYRVPEKLLFTLALLGGAPGGWAGMALFRHKTKHWYFKLFFPLLALLWLAGLVWFFVSARG